MIIDNNKKHEKRSLGRVVKNMTSAGANSRTILEFPQPSMAPFFASIGWDECSLARGASEGDRLPWDPSDPRTFGLVVPTV